MHGPHRQAATTRGRHGLPTAAKPRCRSAGSWSGRISMSSDSRHPRACSGNRDQRRRPLRPLPSDRPPQAAPRRTSLNYSHSDDLSSGQRVELQAQFSLGQRQNPKGNPSKRVATDFTAEDSGLLSRHTSASFANDRVNLRRSETPKTDVRRTVGYSAGR